jgi:hypothetical protein
VQIVEAVVVEKVGTRPPDPAMAFAAWALERGVRVSEISAQMGLLSDPDKPEPNRRERDQGVARLRHSKGASENRWAWRRRVSARTPAAANATANCPRERCRLAGSRCRPRFHGSFKPTECQPRSAEEHSHVPVEPVRLAGAFAMSGSVFDFG